MDSQRFLLLVLYLLHCCYLRTSSVPTAATSIIKSSVYDSEVMVVSYSLWDIDANATDSWISDLLDDRTLLRSEDVSCVLTVALAGQHTNPTGHEYDLCSIGKKKTFRFMPRKNVADASPYLRKDANFRPLLTIASAGINNMTCSYFHWSRGVGYVLCPLATKVCSKIDTETLDMKLHSDRTTDGTCLNPVFINFTTQAASIRNASSPPVDLSICMYSGFRPHKNTRFYDMLEANIEYHRRLGVQRFYIIDRNASHKNVFERHEKDWINTGLVHYTPFTIGEKLNSKTLLPGGFVDQKLSLLLCAHEHSQDKWMLTIDKDEFFTCEYAERQKFQESPEIFDDLALNFFQHYSEHHYTHIMLGMLQRGPFVNLSTDCINGSYPTNMDAIALRALDWEMTMAVHKKYYIAKEYQQDDLKTMLHSHAIASSFAPDKSSNGNRIHADFESLFTEFLMRKEFWPWLQKVGQRPTRFPFSDIHGWEETHGQNLKRREILKRIKLFQNKKCYLWHVNPKWELWYRPVCKRLPNQRIFEVDEKDKYPRFSKKWY